MNENKPPNDRHERVYQIIEPREPNEFYRGAVMGILFCTAFYSIVYALFRIISQ